VVRRRPGPVVGAASVPLPVLGRPRRSRDRPGDSAALPLAATNTRGDR